MNKQPIGHESFEWLTWPNRVINQVKEKIAHVLQDQIKDDISLKAWDINTQSVVDFIQFVERIDPIRQQLVVRLHTDKKLVWMSEKHAHRIMRQTIEDLVIDDFKEYLWPMQAQIIQLIADNELLPCDVSWLSWDLLTVQMVKELISSQVHFIQTQLRADERDFASWDFNTWYLNYQNFCKKAVSQESLAVWNRYILPQKPLLLLKHSQYKQIVHSSFSAQGKNFFIESFSTAVAQNVLYLCLQEGNDEKGTNITTPLNVNQISFQSDSLVKLFVSIYVCVYEIQQEKSFFNATAQNIFDELLEHQIALKKQRNIVPLKKINNTQNEQLDKSHELNTSTIKHAFAYPQDFIACIHDYTQSVILRRVLCNYYKKQKVVTIDHLLDLCIDEIDSGKREYYDFMALVDQFKKYNLIDVQNKAWTDNWSFWTDQWVAHSTDLDENNQPHNNQQKWYADEAFAYISQNQSSSILSSEMLIGMLQELWYTFIDQRGFIEKLAIMMQWPSKKTIVNRLCLHYLYPQSYKRVKLPFQKKPWTCITKLSLWLTTWMRIVFFDNEIQMVGTHDEYELFLKKI